MRLGFDTQARLLGAVALIFRSGEEMVIHAMPARPQFLGPPALSKRTGLPLAGRRGLAAGCGVCSA
jgi:hypothetical protein